MQAEWNGKRKEQGLPLVYNFPLQKEYSWSSINATAKEVGTINVNKAHDILGHISRLMTVLMKKVMTMIVTKTEIGKK